MTYPSEFIDRFKEVYPNEEGILALIRAGEETRVGHFLEAAAKISTNELLDTIMASRESQEKMQELAERVKKRRRIYDEWKLCVSSLL